MQLRKLDFVALSTGLQIGRNFFCSLVIFALVWILIIKTAQSYDKLLDAFRSLINARKNAISIKKFEDYDRYKQKFSSTLNDKSRHTFFIQKV